MTAEGQAQPTDSLLNPVEELRALAGVAKDVDRFEVAIDGVKIRVRYIGGSSQSLFLEIAYDALARPLGPIAGFSPAGGYRDAPPSALRAVRPMKIVLTPERHEHVEGKESGGDIEHQTGDKRFDERVYIDAPSPADALEAIFAQEEVRNAAIALLDAEFNLIELDNLAGDVSACCTHFLKPTLETHSQGSAGAKAFVRLAKNLPAVVAIQGGAHPQPPLDTSTTVLAVLGIASLCVAPMIYFATLSKQCGEDSGGGFMDCMGPGIVGFIVGILTAILTFTFAKPILRRKYGGTSSSSRRIGNFAYGLAVLVFFVTLLVVSLLINGIRS